MTIRTSVFVLHISLCIQIVRTDYDYCPVVCYVYSDDVCINRYSICFWCKDLLLSIIFYSAAMVRF